MRSFPTSFCCLPIICPSAGRTSFTLTVCKGYPARYVSRLSTIQVPLPPLSAPCAGSPGHPGFVGAPKTEFLASAPGRVYTKVRKNAIDRRNWACRSEETRLGSGHMKTLGIDIGTTTISAVIRDSGSGVAEAMNIKNDTFLPEPWERIQDPKKSDRRWNTVFRSC